MLTEFERQELGKITAAADKRALLEEQRDKARGRGFELEREHIRYKAASDLFASQQFQTQLADATTLTQDYQAVLQDYKNAPARKDIQIKRLQIGNSALEGRVWELKQRMQEEKQRENRLEASILTCDRQLGGLVDRKEALEYEAGDLAREVTHTRDRRNALLEGLFSLEGLSQDEQDLLHSGQLDILVYQLTKDSQRNNQEKTKILTELTERLLHLGHLSAKHEQAQRHFSNYSSGQSEQDLINQERALAQEIEETKKRISEERQAEERAVLGCEEKAKEEATRQTQQWLKGKLEALKKIKNCVEIIFGIKVQGNEDDRLELRELKSELWRLEQEEEAFRQRLNERGFHL